MAWGTVEAEPEVLTVFKKQRQRERREIDRAFAAMRRCVEEGHTPEGDG